VSKAVVEVVHFPTLKTVMAIEEVIKGADLALSRNKILSELDKGVMRSTLNVALDYLEKRSLVLETKNGFIWTFNPNKNLEQAEANALEV
jgi:hypothetical protein